MLGGTYKRYQLWVPQKYAYFSKWRMPEGGYECPLKAVRSSLPGDLEKTSARISLQSGGLFPC